MKEMDMEAIERIGVAYCEGLRRFDIDLDYYTPLGKKIGDTFADQILKKLDELGLLLPQEKPPLLSDEEMLIILDNHWENFLIKAYREKVAQSQREADIKHYEQNIDG
jgi:hypothetical protein